MTGFLKEIAVSAKGIDPIAPLLSFTFVFSKWSSMHHLLIMTLQRWLHFSG